MDRRLVLLCLSAALAVVLVFLTFAPGQSLQAVIYGGYWAMLLLTVLFGWSLFKVARDSRPDWPDWRQGPRWPALLITGGSVVVLVHESYGFQILLDEVVLLGTAMLLRLDKNA